MYRKFETYFRNYSPFHIRLRNFGKLWSTKKKVPVAHIDQPKWISFWDYISAIRGCCALNFLNALQIDQDYVAHPHSLPPTETGSPE